MEDVLPKRFLFFTLKKNTSPSTFWKIYSKKTSRIGLGDLETEKSIYDTEESNKDNSNKIARACAETISYWRGDKMGSTTDWKASALATRRCLCVRSTFFEPLAHLFQMVEQCCRCWRW